MIIRFLRIGPSAFFSVFFFSFSPLFWDRSFYRPDRLRTCYSTKDDLEIILLSPPSAGWDCVPPCLGYALLGIEPSAPYQLSYLSWPEYAMQFSAMLWLYRFIFLWTFISSEGGKRKIEWVNGVLCRRDPNSIYTYPAHKNGLQLAYLKSQLFK